LNSRRKFLIGAAGLAGVAGLAGGVYWWRRPRSVTAPGEPPFVPDPAFPNALRLPGGDGMYGVLDAAGALTITARPVRHAILPGKPAVMLAYEAEHLGRTYLNPVLRVRKGTNLRINFWNALEEPSIIHWHGLILDSNNDGHAHYAVPGGATYDYQFTVPNRAGTYWYHPHPHHLTGKQVYLGLAGLFIVEDEDEITLQKALDLRFAETDIPLVLQDRRFDADGRLVFSPSAEERFHGHYGAEVLVNLTPRPHLAAATRLYRFRILNGSNARLYRLAFRHGEKPLDYHVIGNDGGLLERPHAVKEAFLSPGERVDVLLDLRAAKPGDALSLVSLPFDAMHQEAAGVSRPATGEHAHHGSHGAAGTQHATPPDGAALDLLRIQVHRRVDYDRAIPETLSRIEPPAESPYSPRLIVLDRSGMTWRINAATYHGDATPIVVKRGSVEAWDIRNVPPSMPHPLHIHGFQFRVLSRANSPDQQKRLALGPDGLAATDLGWKDTVLTWPGETVRIVTDFSHPFLGDQVYMVHCHNLEHEDGGMMLNLKIAG
jgi:suppressor of ftsI/bilirubin oxidase